MIETLLQNPVFLILALIVALVVIGEGALTVFAFFRGQRDNITKTLNRDQNAMDELHKRVEELKKKD